MSRIVTVILIHHRYKPIDLIYTFTVFLESLPVLRAANIYASSTDNKRF
jgi:hypothetical protein